MDEEAHRHDTESDDATFAGTAENGRDPGIERDGSAPRWRRWRVWAVALGLFLVFYTIPAVFTASPRMCATCHDMQPYYDTWASSRHRGAADTCLHCHAKPGAINRAIYRATMYKDIVIIATRGRVTLFRTSQVTEASCQQTGCHSLNRVFSLSGQIQINHRLHVQEAEVSCVYCHHGAGHEGVEGTSVPPMSLCAECHEPEMDNCAYCHTGRALPTRDDS